MYDALDEALTGEKTGDLSSESLLAGLRKLGRNPTKKVITRMVNQLDVGGGGGGDRLSSSSERRTSAAPSRLRAPTFSSSNRKDGSISFEEFARGMLARNSLLYKVGWGG